MSTTFEEREVALSKLGTANCISSEAKEYSQPISTQFSTSQKASRQTFPERKQAGCVKAVSGVKFLSVCRFLVELPTGLSRCLFAEPP